MAAKVAGPGAANNSPDSEIASLQVTLPQMLDLALGTPEVGAVNLNILHNFLHVLLHQINLRNTKVEFRGDEANRIKTMVASLKAGPSLHFQQYSITDDSGNIKQRVQNTENKTKDSPESVKQKRSAASAPATARGKTGREQGSDTSLEEGAPAAKKSKGVKQQIGVGVNGESQSVIFIEPLIDGTTPTVLAFKQLDDSVRKLHEKFHAMEEFANNPEMIERVKASASDPLSDMWHLINIGKRLDATEQTVDKLATMLQDLIKGDSTGIGTGSNNQTIDEIRERLEHVEEYLSLKPQEIVIEQGTQNEEVDTKAKNNQLKSDVPTTKETDSTTPAISAEATAEIETIVTKPASPKRSFIINTEIAEIRSVLATLKNDVGKVQVEVSELQSKMLKASSIATTEKSGVPQTASIKEVEIQKETTGSVEIEVGETEDTNISSCMEAVKNIEAMYGDALHELGERVRAIEIDIGLIMEKVNSSSMNVMALEVSPGPNELVSKIQSIQADLERVSQTANRLLDEREARETHTNALVEQIELLKTIKADKEDLEDALADKADAQAVNRKVSYDQFDAACDDLARGLEDAIGKLSQQESVWQQALDEVQKGVENKVDKMEMSPLKDFVNAKLKTLQEKLKALSEMRKEAEAAGTKKMLRDVQCISCDKNVVMRMEEGNGFHAEPMPCTRSIKPYLTYELDQVRKQQRKLPHGRNMVQLEAALQEEARKAKATKEEILVKTPRDHLCNRYCGGSHTVTTPQQRVMRVGHFLTQWGPEAIQLTEGLVKGTDGQLYKGRPVSIKPVCGNSCKEDEVDKTIPMEIEAPISNRPSISSARRPSSVSQRRMSARKLAAPAEPPVQDTINEEVTREEQHSSVILKSSTIQKLQIAQEPSKMIRETITESKYSIRQSGTTIKLDSEDGETENA
ncbi:uncharacterized protein LOC107268250 isoform X2 [Cephus cinctus]|uniref:Uncharacterized protein LOC107268250 isoform X2 n=1 Tax=Cephus cinctus TaxID=211228 RepID=A0AAJ7W294_CEPCN|nr:uncharacterized protein LOC107268250 isoform X2 [Cephus cinctus]